MNLIVAFVHLGKNPSPTLNWYAQICSDELTNSDVVLITDYPELHWDFPGQVISVKEAKVSLGVSRFIRSNKAYQSISGGYWRYTTERLFVLAELVNHFELNRPVLHIESDVLINSDEQMLISVAQKIRKTSTVRYSKDSGIASILISPSLFQLQIDLEYLERILISKPNTFSDMSLLGDALNEGILAELPRYPEADWAVVGQPSTFTIFDGAAIGQYLFGLDPIHTGHHQISGYLNPNFELPLNACSWRIRSAVEGSKQQLVFTHKNVHFIPLCIHIHSKILLQPPDSEDPEWQRFISEANGSMERKLGPLQMNNIHLEEITLTNRIRLKMSRLKRSRGIQI
jgi:hypothetical protein